jgi:hypothetical protein
LKLKHKDVTRTKVKLMDFDLVQWGILNLFRDLVLGWNWGEVGVKMYKENKVKKFCIISIESIMLWIFNELLNVDKPPYLDIIWKENVLHWNFAYMF